MLKPQAKQEDNSSIVCNLYFAMWIFSDDTVSYHWHMRTLLVH